MPTAPTILWFRQDMRLGDQAALAAAASEGPVLPVYVLDDETPADHAIGGAQRWWLYHSLTRLAEALEAKGARLILRRGACVPTLRALMAETGAHHIHALRHYEPWWRRAEAELGDTLVLHDGNHLAPPRSIRTGSGGRFKIFTPYWRALLQHMPPPRPLAAPEGIEGVEVASDRLEEWDLLPTRPNWARGFDVWTPGETGALANLETFAAKVAGYERGRNMPSEPSTSRLSPHLHFGEVSPATAWHRMTGAAERNAEPYLREIGWRDYAANTIDQFADYGTTNARADFDSFKWRTGAEAESDFTAWTRGCTGYPIVDAGMRQLWATGWIHNRVRMIVASFLVKHLLIDWRRGERWFWDTLVDADYGSNAVNWQWIAGTGIDSNMFVRIMAPLTQSAKFDAAGYIRQWVPELVELSDDAIHEPGPVCGYPGPLIGHREARARALAAYGAMR